MPPKLKNKPARTQQDDGILATISSFFTFSTYDPHLHRNTTKATNYFETLVHFMKSSLGTGILAMPQAIARAGFVSGVLGTLLTGLLITYCLHLLLSSQYALCKRKRVPLLTYAQSMKEALLVGPKCMSCCGPCAPCVVDFFLIIYQLGICCIYIVFIGRTLEQLFTPHFVSKGSDPWPIYYYMLCSLIFLLVIICVPNLKILAIFSTIANLLTIIALGIVLYELIAGLKYSNGNTSYFGTVGQYPLAFGTILFSLVTVAVVIALENNMKNPKLFVKPIGVLNVSMASITLLYVGLGVIGYLYCTDKCKDTITQNLDPSTTAFKIVQVLYVIAILFSYGLQGFVPVDVIWNVYLRQCFKEGTSKKTLIIVEYVIRIVTCLFTFGIAMAIPRLGLIISLFGTFCLSVLGMSFPALMDFCVSWSETRETGGGCLRRTKDCVIIFIGLATLGLGTYVSIRDIINSFLE